MVNVLEECKIICLYACMMIVKLFSLYVNILGVLLCALWFLASIWSIQ